MAGQEEGTERVKKLLIKYKLVMLIIWLALSVVLLITGVILMTTSDSQDNNQNQIAEVKYTYDYTQCTKFDGDPNDPYLSITCRKYVQNTKNINCICIDVINLNLTGEVTLYYELPSFDQTSEDYTKSRDEDQLRGILTKPPSDNCKPYQYKDGKAIVPCGAVANSMFLDKVTNLKLRNNSSTTVVPLQRNGMLSAEDKSGFQNPENLTESLQNFSKPIDWPRNIYELDKNNADNNGFQNEYFISWMRTDWKRKPVARVDHNNTEFKEGLPAGKYQIEINYVHSPLRYDGQRHLIFVAKNKSSVVETITQTGDGSGGYLAMIVFGIMMTIAGLYGLISTKVSDNENRNKEGRRDQNINEQSPDPLLSQ